MPRVTDASEFVLSGCRPPKPGSTGTGYFRISALAHAQNYQIATRICTDAPLQVVGAAGCERASHHVRNPSELMLNLGFRWCWELSPSPFPFNMLFNFAPPPCSPGCTIVGYQFHYLSYCTWHGGILFGEDLYVVPEFRGKGIGTSLMNKVAKIALEKGCSEFRFICARWNQPAMDFYAKLGAVNVTIRDHWHLCHIEGAPRELGCACSG
uniref:N-acetyltransferase domain-containing protein n=1 Tax=Podarcis muralis TaxID=64176 RepID=A0A670J0L4_PODMU